MSRLQRFPVFSDRIRRTSTATRSARPSGGWLRKAVGPSPCHRGARCRAPSASRRPELSGGIVSLSPGSEMPMGHGLTATQAALDHGIRPSLSVDVETTEPADFFTTIRLTLYLQREQINVRSLAGEKALPKWLTARDVLELATIEGARANGLDRKTGTLTPG